MAENRGASEIVQDDEAGAGDEPIRPFFYSLDDLPAYSIAEFVEEQGFSEEEKQKWFDRFGPELLTKTILVSPNLVVTHESIGPGGKVKPHRHGTHQITYVLKGSLNYGSRKTTAGMGYFSPNMNYSWTAGPEGAEWLEIHAGMPLPYID
jgi:hypothetical protein